MRRPDEMAGVRKLPDCDKLAEHVAEGLLNKDIGEMYGVSNEAVRQQLDKCGLQGNGPKRVDHSRVMPWRVRADHVGDLLARRLRAYSKDLQGLPLKNGEKRLLEEWRAYMDGDNLYGLPASVHYDRSDPEGFWLEPRQAGDHDYISPPR